MWPQPAKKSDNIFLTALFGAHGGDLLQSGRLFRPFPALWGAVVNDPSSVTLWIEELKSGQAGEAQEQLWNRYFSRLVAVARGKIGANARRHADEEDVALSALETFFRGASAGRFPDLRDRNNLWPLLVRITARKALNQIRDGRVQKRGGGRVRGESLWQAAQNDSLPAGIEQLLGDEPTPQFAAQIAEQCQLLLGPLDDELQAVARLKLEGYTTHEIAQRLKSSPRTVERRLESIRRLWETQAESGTT
jgi:DNA-directed RNA polymerase specialized sigma24 family protein